MEQRFSRFSRYEMKRTKLKISDIKNNADHYIHPQNTIHRENVQQKMMKHQSSYTALFGQTLQNLPEARQGSKPPK